MMMFTRCNSAELQMGALRELVARRGHCRRGKLGRAQQDGQAFLGTLYRVGKHQIRRGRRATRSSTSQRSPEPLWARIKGVTREVSEGKDDLLPRVCFFPTRVNKERQTGMIRRAFFRDAHRALDGWMLARAPAFPAQGLHRHGPLYYIFSYLCLMGGLEKLGLVDQK